MLCQKYFRKAFLTSGGRAEISSFPAKRAAQRFSFGKPPILIAPSFTNRSVKDILNFRK